MEMQTSEWKDNTKVGRMKESNWKEGKTRIMKLHKGIERKEDDGSIFHKPYLLLALSTFPALF